MARLPGSQSGDVGFNSHRGRNGRIGYQLGRRPFTAQNPGRHRVRLRMAARSGRARRTHKALGDGPIPSAATRRSVVQWEGRTPTKCRKRFDSSRSDTARVCLWRSSPAVYRVRSVRFRSRAPTRCGSRESSRLISGRSQVRTLPPGPRARGGTGIHGGPRSRAERHCGFDPRRAHPAGVAEIGRRAWLKPRRGPQARWGFDSLRLHTRHPSRDGAAPRRYRGDGRFDPGGWLRPFSAICLGSPTLEEAVRSDRTQ
jgi:hypothetical protein